MGVAPERLKCQYIISIELYPRLEHLREKSSAALVFWLMFYPASGHAAAGNEVLCEMYFVGFHWQYELFPTKEDLAQCIKDPAGRRDAYLGRLGGSSGGFRDGGTGPLGFLRAVGGAGCNGAWPMPARHS